eukprot:4404480-Pleurochrysis_carterae.AAC.1
MVCASVCSCASEGTSACPCACFRRRCSSSRAHGVCTGASCPAKVRACGVRACGVAKRARAVGACESVQTHAPHACQRVRTGVLACARQCA